MFYVLVCQYFDLIIFEQSLEMFTKAMSFLTKTMAPLPSFGWGWLTRAHKHASWRSPPDKWSHFVKNAMDEWEVAGFEGYNVRGIPLVTNLMTSHVLCLSRSQFTFIHYGWERDLWPEVRLSTWDSQHLPTWILFIKREWLKGAGPKNE